MRGTSSCFVLSRSGTHAVFSTGVFHFHFEGTGLFLGAGSSGLAPSSDGEVGMMCQKWRGVFEFFRGTEHGDGRWDLDLRWRSRFSWWYAHTHTHIEDTQASAVLTLSLPYTHTDFIIDNMLKKTPNTGLTAFPISQTAVTHTHHTQRGLGCSGLAVTHWAGSGDGAGVSMCALSLQQASFPKTGCLSFLSLHNSLYCRPGEPCWR